MKISLGQLFDYHFHLGSKGIGQIGWCEVQITSSKKEVSVQGKFIPVSMTERATASQVTEQDELKEVWLLSSLHLL